MTPIFLDIETRCTDNPAIIKRLHDAVKPPGQYKKAESIATWYMTEGNAAKQEALDKTALEGTWGSIATIGIAVGDGEPNIISTEALDERTVLEFFAATPKPLAHIWVAFNAEFDFRFLRQRAIINRVRLPHTLLGRDVVYYDPMREWAGYRGYIKQSDLELALGIERNDPLSGGADIGRAIEEGRWADVVAHNTQDIVCLRQIYKRMTDVT